MLSERKLRKWRKEALEEQLKPTYTILNQECIDRVLQMTQELLDQHLINKKWEGR